MRRCTLRGRKNILKRQLLHVGAFNVSFVLRKMLGAGTPQERAFLIALCGAASRLPAHSRGASPLIDGFCAKAFCYSPC
jgi:hypothetical protein